MNGKTLLLLLVLLPVAAYINEMAYYSKRGRNKPREDWDSLCEWVQRLRRKNKKKK